MSYNFNPSALTFFCSSFIVLTSSFSPLPSLAQQTYQQWLKKDQQAFTAYEAEITAAYGKYLEEEAAAFNAFVKTAGKKWGKENVWVPEKTTWVQYREDWEERSSVQFEDGTAKIEVIVAANASEAEIESAVADAVESLVLSGSISPIEMMRRKLFPSRYQTPQNSQSRDRAPHPEESPVNYRPTSNQMPPPYIVKRGDNLWTLSRRFDVSRKKIAIINGISTEDRLKIGQELYIPYKTKPAPATSPSTRLPPGGTRHSESGAYSPPMPAHSPQIPKDPRLAAKGSDPLLHRQLKMPDGTAVTQSNSRKFAEHVASNKQRTTATITGSDGKQRHVIKTQFPLVPNHVRIRAERFRPFVTKYAQKEGVYAPLVYAIMHSESSFNPRARSGAPAYGLMQLVPRSGARDAYRYVHKKDKLVSGSYLYNPENNIELGIAFLHILDQRYFRRVQSPTNRMLCSIAAYNTGAGNVCKAFGAGTSLSRAAPIINRMEPAEVYARLRSDLPYAETRHYIKKVRDRISLYKAWE